VMQKYNPQFDYGPVIDVRLKPWMNIWNIQSLQQIREREKLNVSH
jgi:hypothetical protein